jgi:cytochrome c peroxidase
MRVKGIVFLVLLGFITVSTAFHYEVRGGAVAPSDSVRFAVPANFPKPVYDFKDNSVTSNGFKLGRILFYDPVLSKDKSISCANCHQSFAAFANLDHTVSHGVDECLGTRNTPPLFNLAWQKEFMWDGGVHHIEVSPMNAMTNPCEMAMDLNTIVSRLQQTEPYPVLFKDAFGTPEINSQRVFRAMAQFTSMLVSSNSRYDKYIRKEAGGDFSLDELSGYALFKQKCSTCHQEPLFTDGSYRNNGLELKYDDIGRDSITHLEADRGKFRVPSLRNVELTSPYMHDGRFATLKEVLQHYNSGVKHHTNLDPELQRNGRLGITLTTKEQDQLIAFLKTLTDKEFVSDKRFQAPDLHTISKN